ncbi:hypothetical protein BJX70DRAFT_392501 [Aspergillus crustosus]
MNSCLALSAKQMALKSSPGEEGEHENVAIGYYRKAVRTFSVLLADSDHARSDEILASSIILSTYEMLDVVGDSFGSHLNGIAFFLQSRQVNGDSQGIEGAAYWTWYRHEIRAALQTGRRMFLEDNYWQPEPLDSFNGLSVHCKPGPHDDDDDVNTQHAQHRRAVALDASLDQRQQKLPLSMAHFLADRHPNADGSRASDFPFEWFLYPPSAIAHQVYHASKILLRLHRPSLPSENTGPGRNQYLSNRREIEKSRQQIFLVSNSGIPDTWSLVSTQCLFVAGLVTEGVLEQHHTLRLIESCQRSSGRRTICLANELRRLCAQ